MEIHESAAFSQTGDVLLHDQPPDLFPQFPVLRELLCIEFRIAAAQEQAADIRRQLPVPEGAEWHKLTAQLLQKLQICPVIKAERLILRDADPDRPGRHPMIRTDRLNALILQIRRLPCNFKDPLKFHAF